MHQDEACDRPPSQCVMVVFFIALSSLSIVVDSFSATDVIVISTHDYPS
jgi:hypothetical protein